VERILLFGGSFNPIHHGHLIVARHAAETLGLNRVILMPSALPPHKPSAGLAPASDRLAMCQLAVENDPQFEVSDWEIRREGPNYTLETIRHFRESGYEPADVHWLIGMDSLHELGTWYRATELVDECTIVTVARPGAAHPTRAALRKTFGSAQADRLLARIVDGPHIDIASTDIRARTASGAGIRYLVPESVRAFIGERGLYAARQS